MEERGDEMEGERLLDRGTALEDGEVRGKESGLKDRVCRLDGIVESEEADEEDSV